MEFFENFFGCLVILAGQERFHALAPLYYRDAEGIMLVYDITDRTSFERMKNWVKEIKTQLGFKEEFFWSWKIVFFSVC